MRWLAFILILNASLCMAAPLCPDPHLREARIGGDSITGTVLLRHKPFGFALVRVYSSPNAIPWFGMTDKNGGFATSKLPPADYRLEVIGWGSTSVRLDPNLDKQFGGQVPVWRLLLTDDGCVGSGMTLN